MKHKMIDIARTSLGLVFAVFVLVLVAPAAQAGAEADFIRKLGDDAISMLGESNRSLAERETGFRTILTEGFDMPLIARFALGRYWRIASKEQRRDYLILFTDYVVKSYAVKLGGYKNEALIIVSEQPLQNRKDVLVDARISRPRGEPIKIVWRVRNGKKGLRVIDVIVEGISMLLTYRDEFGAVIQRHGLTGLLETLKARVGTPYDQGKSVERDPRQAVELWRKAANKNYVRAQHNLASSYISGEGVPQDYGEAVKFLRRAEEYRSALLQRMTPE